jgi:hypothetical protein
MIESKTILVPTSLKDVKLHQMLAYQGLKEDMEDTQRQLEAVSIFCELTMTEVMAMPFDVLQKAVERITLMLTEQPTFTPRFKMDGVEYGFIPNLDDMSVGEFIDIETYTKETHDLWKVMSVLYRPVTHSGQNGRYEVAPYSANLVTGFKDLDCNTAFGAMVFFWSLGIDLLNSIQKYLEGPTGQQMKTALPKNGDGLEWSIDSLQEISYAWKMSILRPFTPLCIGPLTKATLRKWNKKLLSKVTSDDK